MFEERIGRIFALLFIVNTLLLSSCGSMETFSSGEEPQSETAVIKGSGFFPIKNVWIIAVDGKKLGMSNSKAVVLPGQHTLNVHINQSFGVGSFSANGVVIFTAIAGHEYAVKAKAEADKRKAYFWVEDVQTSEIVGGRKPE